MKYRICAVALLTGAAMAVPTAAWAAPPPTNPNIAVAGTLSCPVPIGTQPLSFNIRVQENPIGFLASGQVVVAKQITNVLDTVTITLASDGTVLAGPVTSSVPDEITGVGPADMLLSCTFELHFTFTAPLDAETAQFFGIASSFVGQLVTFHDDVTGSVTVIPGGPRS